ncbi:hypothetical protein VOWphi5012_085 [Vibrio phage phi50-12]|uniref:Uncharacterized protein n=1 Tax=Vibrio phage phi50-12 TaxID=2654972 RepID=A0A5P8PRE2_9CAUD|nr:hypothetical protein KNU82_gp085 [Vibrio phage phi50-12]QFR59868.1 hypothetical protein VOWphi5012_085 [Vibrio phage phi50-12]
MSRKILATINEEKFENRYVGRKYKDLFKPYNQPRVFRGYDLNHCIDSLSTLSIHKECLNIILEK